MANGGVSHCSIQARVTAANSATRAPLPGVAGRVRINLNGCPKSCVRFQLADIGPQGALGRGPDGQRVEGFLVHPQLMSLRRTESEGRRRQLRVELAEAARVIRPRVAPEQDDPP